MFLCMSVIFVLYNFISLSMSQTNIWPCIALWTVSHGFLSSLPWRTLTIFISINITPCTCLLSKWKCSVGYMCVGLYTECILCNFVAMKLFHSITFHFIEFCLITMCRNHHPSSITPSGGVLILDLICKANHLACDRASRKQPIEYGSSHEGVVVLFTLFCYILIAKPGNKTAAPSWPDPYP